MKTKSLLSSVAVLATMVGIGMPAMAVSADNVTLPAATSTTENSASGSVSGVSDAIVQVEQGYLTLDAVPDMNFGMAAQTKTANENLPLINNAGLIDDNGNDSGLLKVTDSRTAAASNDDDKTPMAAETTTMPWQLTATLGDFSSTDGATLTSSKDWAIHLNQTSGKNTDGHMPAIYQPKLMSGDNTQHRVMQSAQGTGYGSTTVYYSKAKDAALDMSANVPEGKYSAPITWTLNATPDASVN